MLSHLIYFNNKFLIIKAKYKLTIVSLKETLILEPLSVLLPTGPQVSRVHYFSDNLKIKMKICMLVYLGLAVRNENFYS